VLEEFGEGDRCAILKVRADNLDTDRQIGFGTINRHRRCRETREGGYSGPNHMLFVVSQSLSTKFSAEDRCIPTCTGFSQISAASRSRLEATLPTQCWLGLGDGVGVGFRVESWIRLKAAVTSGSETNFGKVAFNSSTPACSCFEKT
jgi:hypothetical protein